MKELMSKLYRTLLLAMGTFVLLTLSPAHAQETNSSSVTDTNTAELIRQLQQRVNELEQKLNQLQSNKPPVETETHTNQQQQIEELDQQVKILKRNRELDQDAAEAKAKEMPKISIGGDGFSFGSADGNFNIRLGGVLQVDSRTFYDDDNLVGNDALLLRRARPTLQGTVFRDFDFLFVPDFAPPSGPQIFDAYLNYRYSPALQLQAGKFKSPVGLEQLQADRDILFNERSLVTDLVPNRDIGFELHGSLFDGRVSYAAGIFNGVGDARNSSNTSFQNDKGFAGRLFFEPFRKSSLQAAKGLGFGVGGSYDSFQTTNTTGLPSTTGGTLPGYTTDGQQQWFAYTNTVAASSPHWRVSPQGYYYYGPLGLLAEYAISDQEVTQVASQTSAHLANTAWEVTGSWVLTGEDATFAGGVIPRHPFDPCNGGWGALQLVGRYAELHVDQDAFPIFANPAASASSAHSWAAGLNWYLNRNVEVKVSFSHTLFNGGGGPGSSPPATITRQDENVLFTRVQLAF